MLEKDILRTLAQVLRNQQNMAALVYASVLHLSSLRGVFVHHQDIYDALQGDSEKLLDEILEGEDA